MYCIYRITNTINGKTYIGQHKYTDEANPMGKYKGSGKLLKLAYKKYGKENFETEVLYKRIRDKTTVDSMEIWAIEKYKPDYNIARGGSGGITYIGECPLKGIPKPWVAEKALPKTRESDGYKNRDLSNRNHSYDDEWKKKVSEQTKIRMAEQKAKDIEYIHSMGYITVEDLMKMGWKDKQIRKLTPVGKYKKLKYFMPL